MTITVNIPEKLHRALPTDCSTSSLIRNLLESAVNNPSVLAEAFASRGEFVNPQLDIKRFTVYLPEDECSAADSLAARYLLSRNQLIQILLENVMFRAGHWPPATIDTAT